MVAESRQRQAVAWIFLGSLSRKDRGGATTVDRVKSNRQLLKRLHPYVRESEDAWGMKVKVRTADNLRWIWKVVCNDCRRDVYTPALSLASAAGQVDLCDGCATKRGYNLGTLARLEQEQRALEADKARQKKAAMKYNQADERWLKDLV